MDALEFRMEKIINHIISTTYPDKHFARLHVVFLRKDTKSFHGTYDPKKQLARIGNLSRSPAHIIATLLHEADITVNSYYPDRPVTRDPSI